jgi:hypothetical protein
LRKDLAVDLGALFYKCHSKWVSFVHRITGVVDEKRNDCWYTKLCNLLPINPSIVEYNWAMISIGKTCCLSSAQAVLNYTQFLSVSGIQRKKTGYQEILYAKIREEAAFRAL